MRQASVKLNESLIAHLAKGEGHQNVHYSAAFVNFTPGSIDDHLLKHLRVANADRVT